MAQSIRALFFFIVGLLLVGVIDARGLGANAAGGTTTRNSPRSAVKSVASAVLAQSAAAAREVADAPARAEGRRALACQSRVARLGGTPSASWSLWSL
mgnify:CR=1 FL=1